MSKVLTHNELERQYKQWLEKQPPDDMVFFTGLYIKDLRIAAKLIWGKYGRCWKLREDVAAAVGKVFIGTGNSKSLKELGFEERQEIARGRPAYLTDHKKNSYIGYVRLGDEWGLDSLPVELEI